MSVWPFICWLLLTPAQDAHPALWERDRFPSRELCCKAMAFNREYRKHVEGRQLWEPHRFWYWQDVLHDTDYVWHCLDWCHAAQGGEGRDAEYWRRSLYRLRELIGDDAFYRGELPPAVPIWAFTPVYGRCP